MSLKSLARAWNQFFFSPRSPTPVCLFRVLFGLLAAADFVLLRPDWLAWFGTRGITTLDTMHRLEPGTRIDLFTLLTSDAQVKALFWLALISAICLTAGFLTRASSIAVFLCLVSINERALYAMNSGDSLLRVTGFWLMFAPAGAAFSVDRLIRLRRGKEPPQIPLHAPWAQRMIQIQLSLVYLATFWQKTLGPTWINGTALYYVYQLDQFHRFPLPSFIQDPMFLRFQTWITLAIEFSLGTLIWFRELRYPLLAIGLALHLALEYSMNVPLFQWIILSVYVTFIEPEDLARAWRWVSARVRMPLVASAPVTAGGAPHGGQARVAAGRGWRAARLSK
jgi:hypothetical protein